MTKFISFCLGVIITAILAAGGIYYVTDQLSKPTPDDLRNSCTNAIIETYPTTPKDGKQDAFKIIPVCASLSATDQATVRAKLATFLDAAVTS